MGEAPDASRWRDEKKLLRRGPGTLYRRFQTWRFLLGRDRKACQDFLHARYPIELSLWARLRLLRRLMRISDEVRGYHTLSEILRVGDHILRLAGRQELRVVEVGAGSGASTAKLSLFVEIARGKLDVIDTFQGIPDNDEHHQLIDGRDLRFMRGAFRGRLGAVERRVREHGAIDVCAFHKGLAQDLLPALGGHVDVALIDVDLIASTRACVEHLLPRLREGGRLFSQDGHLRATHELLGAASFWQGVFARPAPPIEGLLRSFDEAPPTKLIAIHPFGDDRPPTDGKHEAGANSLERRSPFGHEALDVERKSDSSATPP